MTALREVPLPPPELRLRVAGTDNAEWFEKSGRLHVERFAQALSQIGKRFEDFDDIYDFGCGPGRILRHLKKSAPHARLSGSDIDEPAIEWVRRHMSDVNAQANGWLPPLPFPAGGFDLVLGFSVFTHLSEEFQDAWLRELRRVTRPGAIALLTVHGESSWRWHSTESALANVDGIEDVGLQRQAHGFSHCRAGVQPGFPDFYGTTFHVPAYIHRHWSRWFEVVRVIEAAAGSDHDVVVLRRPGPAGTALHALRRLPRCVHGRLQPERLPRSTHLSETESTDRAAHPRCFLHIPKSAGSSVRSALTAALPAGSIAPQRCDSSIFGDFEDFDALPSDTRAWIAVGDDEVRLLADYRVVSGHFSLPSLLQVAPPQSIASVLREPRARLLSLYAYWRLTDGLTEALEPWDAIGRARGSVDEFISDRRIAAWVDNQVCRTLLHGDDRIPIDGFIRPSEVEPIAAAAIELLDAFGFVGVLELGDSARAGLSRMFGVEVADLRENVTGDGVRAIPPPAGGFITSDTLDLLAARTAADAIVYDQALEVAGLSRREARRLADTAFATQLVRLGDLAGGSTARLREGESIPAALTSEAGELATAMNERDRATRDLEIELERHRHALDQQRGVLAAVERSASWRLTAPLRSVKRALNRVRGGMPAEPR